ncbi:MAG: HAD family hydrolase [Verrucomicrobiota bacterium]
MRLNFLIIVAYKHVIWDWNGTLMDDSWLCLEIMNGILTRRGREPIQLEDYRENFQFPVQRYYDWLQFDPSEDPFSKVSHEFIDAYEQRRTECRLFDGVVDALAYWHQDGIEQVVLSAYRHNTLIEIVTHYGLTGYFDRLIGLDNIYAEGKSDLAESHAASLRHEPHEVLLIGDTVHDAEVAAKIGADCVLIADGHNSLPRLLATGCPVVPTILDLEQVLDLKTRALRAS